MILCIETTSFVCSVALFHQGVLVAIEESMEAKNHSSVIVPMIDQLMASTHTKFTDLRAITVSAGPGSYTGLRIGVSTAKGFCSALGIPLLAVPTLQAIAKGFIQEHKLTAGLVCPMFDARRMEVYCWLGDHTGKEIQAVQPLIVDEHLFSERLTQQKIFFIGEGSKKVATVLHHSNAHFVSDFQPSARWLGTEAQERLAKQQTEDLAYFEPFYLKETLVTMKKKQ
jgi:tRNA threonylcarbamoyladenosine biosynthesis protein TsaB